MLSFTSHNHFAGNFSQKPYEIGKNIFSTGKLEGIEQPLVVNTDIGLLVVVDCSHPGVGSILDAASRFGKVYSIVSGFHGLHDFKQLNGLSLICPCHCTQYKSGIKHLFPQQCLECGVRLVLELLKSINLIIKG